MRRFLVLLPLVYASGCQSLSTSKATSSWYALNQAGDVKCNAWPLREKDLEIDEIDVVHGGGTGFLISGLKRDATPLNYFAPFDSDGADPAKFAILSLGRGAVIVGGGRLGAQDVAVVVHNFAAKAAIELRTVPGNVVKFQADLGPFNVVEGTSVSSKGGIWVSYKTEDNTHHVAFLSTRVPSKVTSRVLADVILPNPPRILTTVGKAGALIIWKDGESGNPFKARVLHEDGPSDPSSALEIPVAQLESWSAVASGGAYYLALIDGDTMIGQAELKVSAIAANTNGLDVKWTKALPLTDIHATDPVFIGSSHGLEVLLLNWIDEESTIARYLIGTATIGKPSYSGIFQKGTRIMEAFNGDETVPYAITRHRDGTRWAFQVCELKE